MLVQPFQFTPIFQRQCQVHKHNQYCPPLLRNVLLPNWNNRYYLLFLIMWSHDHIQMKYITNWRWAVSFLAVYQTSTFSKYPNKKCIYTDFDNDYPNQFVIAKVWQHKFTHVELILLYTAVQMQSGVIHKSNGSTFERYLGFNRTPQTLATLYNFTLLFPLYESFWYIQNNIIYLCQCITTAHVDGMVLYEGPTKRYICNTAYP